MGKEYIYNKQCRYCGKELTSETTSRNFINDQNFICFECIEKERRAPERYRFSKLEKLYDPGKNKAHEAIYKKAQVHTDQVEVREELLLVSPKPKERIYPNPKGRPIIIRHHEIMCRDCDMVLTTTNAYPEEVRSGHYTCKKCKAIIRDECNNDPLHKEKKEIKTILHKIYARRRLKQFTWEYVNIRFSKIKETKTLQVDKEEYDKTVKLFGEEYAAKRYRPRTGNALQTSFGDLSSRDGCKKLLALFEYELYKSRHSGKRKKEKYEARLYLKRFDSDFNKTIDYNTGTNSDNYEVRDTYYDQAYSGLEYKPKVWDPYIPEV